MSVSEVSAKQPPIETPHLPSIPAATVTAAPRQRSIVIDVVRGLAISLVVIGHTDQGILHRDWWGSAFPVGVQLNDAIYSFHMAAFFFVSGIFLRPSLAKRGPRHFVSNRLQTIIYPYLVWSLIGWAANVLLHRYMETDIWTPRNYLYYVVTGNQGWFLPTIFVALMLAMLLRKVPMALLFVLACAAGMLWHPVNANDIDYAIHYLPFLVLGMGVGANFEQIAHIPRLPSALLALVLCAAVWALAVFKPAESRLLYIPVGILGTLMLMLLAGALSRSAFARGLAWVGEASFGIFLLSAYPQGGTRELVFHLFHTTSPIPHLIVPSLVAILVPAWIYMRRQQLHLGWLFVWPFQRRVLPDGPAARGAVTS